MNMNSFGRGEYRLRATLLVVFVYSLILHSNASSDTILAKNTKVIVNEEYEHANNDTARTSRAASARNAAPQARGGRGASRAASHARTHTMALKNAPISEDARYTREKVTQKQENNILFEKIHSTLNNNTTVTEKRHLSARRHRHGPNTNALRGKHWQEMHTVMSALYGPIAGRAGANGLVLPYECGGGSIHCDEDDEVIGLDITDNFNGKPLKLSGTLPDLARAFPRLEFFSLRAQPAVHGTLPDTLAALGGTLTRFIVEETAIDGTLPPSLVHCTALERLELPFNRLSGRVDKVDWRGLRSLRVLDLRGNALGGWIPLSFASFASHQLHTLSLDGNRLIGTVPPSVQQSLRDVAECNLGHYAPQREFGRRGNCFWCASDAQLDERFAAACVVRCVRDADVCDVREYTRVEQLPPPTYAPTPAPTPGLHIAAPKVSPTVSAGIDYDGGDGDDEGGGGASDQAQAELNAELRTLATERSEVEGGVFVVAAATAIGLFLLRQRVLACWHACRKREASKEEILDIIKKKKIKQHLRA